MYELIGSGGILDAIQLSSYESRLAEGQMARLEMDVRYVPYDAIAQLENQLRQRGVPEARVEAFTTASGMVRISWRKGFPWLPVIVAAILGIIVLAILIVGWRLYREVVPAGLQPVVGGLGSIGLLMLIGLGIVLLARRV